MKPNQNCPWCNGSGIHHGRICICSKCESAAKAATEKVAVFKNSGPPIIMDEDDFRRDLQRLCQEQRDTITELTTMRNSLVAALKDTLPPLQDAQNQLHHVAAAAAYINAREIIRHIEPDFARGVS